MNNHIAFNIGDVFFGRPSNFLTKLTDLGLLVSIIASNAIIIAGVILIFLIIFAGFTMITGAGDPQKQHQAQQIMTWGVVGFILVVAAFLIIRIIEVSLGIDILGQNAG